LFPGPYADQLEATGGEMPEFVNPKYKDATKDVFKAPTRLECALALTKCPILIF